MKSPGARRLLEHLRSPQGGYGGDSEPRSRALWGEFFGPEHPRWVGYVACLVILLGFGAVFLAGFGSTELMLAGLAGVGVASYGLWAILRGRKFS